MKERVFIRRGGGGIEGERKLRGGGGKQVRGGWKRSKKIEICFNSLLICTAAKPFVKSKFSIINKLFLYIFVVYFRFLYKGVTPQVEVH